MNVMYFYCYNLQTNPKNTSVTQLFTLLRLGDLWVYWETTPVMIVIKSFTKIFCLHRLSTFWKIVLYKLLQNWSDFQMRESTGQTINTQTVDETTNFLITNHDLFRLIIQRPNNDKTDVPGCYCYWKWLCACLKLSWVFVMVQSRSQRPWSFWSTRLVMVLYFAKIKRLSKIKRLFLKPFVIKVCFNVSNKWTVQ